MYRARDLVVGDEVAVNVLLPTRADGRSVQRFLGEARTLAQINHPCVVTLRDSGQSGMSFYFVMELLDGRLLAEEIVSAAPFAAARAATDAAETLFWVGRVHEVKGEFAASRATRCEAIERFEAAGDPLGAARVRLALGHMEAAFVRDFPRGLALLAKATSVLEGAGDPRLLARCYSAMASVNTEAESFEEAIEGYRRARALFSRAGDLKWIAACMQGWGTTLACQGRGDEGHVYLEAALRLYENLDYRRGVAICRVNLSMAARVAGRLEEAVEWAKGAIAMAHRIESPIIATYARSELGRALLALGTLDEAEAMLRAVVAEPWAVKAMSGEPLDGLAQIALARGDRDAACRLLRQALDAAEATAGRARLVEDLRARIVSLCGDT